jgi:hypothetical protein
VNRKVLPSVPDSVPIAKVMLQSSPLQSLRQRLADSNARFAAVRACMPAMLFAHVKAGPVDDEGWSMLAANASVAAKLRQLQPRMEAALRAQGWQQSTIRIKVLTD